MSALAEPLSTDTVCTRCGARLVADQEWCLECGAATGIRIHPAPDWRVPVAIVGAIVLLFAAALVFVLGSLSSSANRSAAAAVAAAPATGAAIITTGTSATTPVASTTPASPTTGIASWPHGMTGYTVILDVIPGKTAATANATKIAATGIPVGLLYSSDYSSMTPGDWIVFSGTYTTRAAAARAASQLKAKGQTGAYAFSVVPAAG